MRGDRDEPKKNKKAKPNAEAKGAGKNRISRTGVGNDIIHTNISFSQVDFWLLLSVILLVGIGTMMIFSASTPSAFVKNAGSTAYDVLKVHIVYAVSGIFIMVLMSYFNYRVYGRFALLIFIIATGLMGAVFSPLGITLNNARRWLRLGTAFQPSEFLKLAVVIFVACVLSREKLRDKARGPLGLFLFVAPVGVNLILLALQPHISCVLIITVVVAAMMFAGKVKPVTFIIIIVLIAVVVVGVILFSLSSDSLSFNYILERLAAHSGEGADDASTYQATQSMYAIGSGGLFGRGFGRSVQKYLYLPEPYNDFIFSILAEELGLVGVVLVIALFTVLILRGYKISANAPDLFSSLLSFGIVTNVAIQVLMNLAVVSKLMPVTGISLPFFSYGGTSLWIMMASMGILLNISKQSRYSKF